MHHQMCYETRGPWLYVRMLQKEVISHGEASLYYSHWSKDFCLFQHNLLMLFNAYYSQHYASMCQGLSMGCPTNHPKSTPILRHNQREL